MRVGERIAAARRRKGWSQSELAQRSSLTRGSVANIELGRQRAPLDTVWRIGAALGVEPRMLLPSVSDLQPMIGTGPPTELPPQVEGYLARLADGEAKVKALIHEATAELTDSSVRGRGPTREKKKRPD